MRKNTLVGSITRRMAVGLGCLLPLLMGGCPEFRDEVVSAAETATLSTFRGESGVTVANTARVSFIEAGISLLFGQLRSDGR